MSATDELLENNAGYAASFDEGDRPKRPARRSPSWPAWTRGSIPTRCSGSGRATRT